MSDVTDSDIVCSVVVFSTHSSKKPRGSGVSWPPLFRVRSPHAAFDPTVCQLFRLWSPLFVTLRRLCILAACRLEIPAIRHHNILGMWTSGGSDLMNSAEVWCVTPLCDLPPRASQRFLGGCRCAAQLAWFMICHWLAIMCLLFTDIRRRAARRRIHHASVPDTPPRVLPCCRVCLRHMPHSEHHSQTTKVQSATICHRSNSFWTDHVHCASCCK